jgi:hypothetical protein
MIITWNTTKTAGGFEYRIYQMGYQMAAQTLKTGICATRAQATLRAKKWTRYFKATKETLQ